MTGHDVDQAATEQTDERTGCRLHRGRPIVACTDCRTRPGWLKVAVPYFREQSRQLRELQLQRSREAGERQA